jgi:hypothetical protein
LIQKNIVSSDELRQLVSQELRNRNESTIAESYSGYSKNKVTTDIQEEITSSNNKYNSKVGQTTRTQSNLRWIGIKGQVVVRLVDKDTLLAYHNKFF